MQFQMEVSQWWHLDGVALAEVIQYVFWKVPARWWVPKYVRLLAQSSPVLITINVGLGMGGCIDFYFVRWHEHGGARFCRANVRWCASKLWHRRYSVADVCAFFQLYFWTYSFSSPRCRNLLSWIVGCKPSSYLSFASRTDFGPCTRHKYNWLSSWSSFDRLGLCRTSHGGRFEFFVL